MSEDLVKYEPAKERQLLLHPVMNVALAKQRLGEFQGFVKEYLVENEDYGTIPGTPKPTLYKPGSDKLCELYGLADTYEITSRLEDWEKNLFDYEIRCTLLNKRDGSVVATGLGSCNSWEGRYRWRDSQRQCPHCQKSAIIKGKTEYGGGWLCYGKKGGCGAKFPDGDRSIEGQIVGRVENDDIPTLKNTILKMAKKRAKVDATLAATRSSGIFTQDVEDFPGSLPDITAPRTDKAASASKTEAKVERAKQAQESDLPNVLAKEIFSAMYMPCFTDAQRQNCADFLNQLPLPPIDSLRKKLAQIQAFAKKAAKAEVQAAQAAQKATPAGSGSTDFLAQAGEESA